MVLHVTAGRKEERSQRHPSTAGAAALQWTPLPEPSPCKCLSRLKEGGLPGESGYPRRRAGRAHSDRTTLHAKAETHKTSQAPGRCRILRKRLPGHT